MTEHPPLPERPTWADLVEGDVLTHNYNSSHTWKWHVMGQVYPLPPYPGYIGVPICTYVDGKPFGPTHTVRFRVTDLVADLGTVTVITPSPTRRKK
ncbi:hypothetical protein GCM10010466_39230 [Planomonospora alba]|uniref:Uncharacterized protein n=1 Tax=Planomonospora alba TaxID=161354 RepID=A0ABP6ND18_9ACTN